MATIFAWTGALRKRGELDGISELCDFADRLEKATLGTIESGKMTKDLALITSIPNPTVLNSKDFILQSKKNWTNKMTERMDRLMAGPFFEKFYADASLLAYHPSNKQKRTKKEREGDVMSELLVRKARKGMPNPFAV